MSVWLSVTEWGPSASVGVVKGELQGAAEPPSTVQVVAPGWLSSIVNVISGVWPEIDWPSAGEVTVSTGAVVSTLKETSAEPTFSAASVCLTTTV
ncbi:MAG: hypothetical protein Q7V62_09570 [Actinomycetota bacterium]|nr:hypothetical protein [Actinomycetota bacterium]